MVGQPNLIDQPGTREHVWDSWPELRQLPPVDPRTWPSVVVVAAHPDDEVLGVGGTISILAAAGARVRLVAVTDGEGSHPDSDPAAVARTRAAESAAALGLLCASGIGASGIGASGIGASGIEVIRLGYPDTGLARREEELAAALGEQCAGFGVCLAPWEADVHADHEAAGRAAWRAGRLAGARVLTYPIWMWHWATPGDRRVPWHRACQVRLPAEVAARKRAAIDAFASQLTDRGPEVGPVLPAGIVAHFTRSEEVLLR
ncbi:MAG TPA: PIG-L deacetylase family protein [Streptosporangiaceae bacterium]|nr:PIG-L deacetylase family protein [Streptosporangiaceae bacterium]